MTKSTLQITYLGHATFLIEVNGDGFLTDANFSARLFRFFKRRVKPGLNAWEIPPPSLLLVTNSDYGHLDIFSYKYFKTTTPIVAPKGVAGFIRRHLPNPITEMVPGGTHLHRDCQIHACKVAHRGYRWLPIRYRLATAYVMETPGGTLYFAGETRYGKHFAETAKQFKIDGALLPIRHQGAKKTKHRSLSPKEALQAAKDLKVKYLIPYSLDTFQGGLKDPLIAFKDLEEAAMGKKLDFEIQILKPRETFEIEKRKPHLYPLPTTETAQAQS